MERGTLDSIRIRIVRCRDPFLAFARVLYVYMTPACTIQHNKVYGLLGLVKASDEAHGLIVDYNLSLEELFLKVVRMLKGSFCLVLIIVRVLCATEHLSSQPYSNPPDE